MATAKRIAIPDENIPTILRFRIWVGSLRYPQRNVGGGTHQVFRLPSRKIAKLWCPPNELAAMEFVARNTTVPIPTIHEIYDYGHGQHIVMEEVPGGDIQTCYGQMTPEQIKTFGAELGQCLAQMRSLTPPQPNLVASVSLGPNVEHRLSGTPFGPFFNIEDFHTYLRFGWPLEHWVDEPDLIRVHSHPERYCTKFSHAELNPNNIMVKDGHINAIIDWEFAGWYPEYWDYTKMHWCPRTPPWNNFYTAVDGEKSITKYPDELAAEQAIWKRTHPWSYDSPPWQPDENHQSQEEDSVIAQ